MKRTLLLTAAVMITASNPVSASAGIYPKAAVVKEINQTQDWQEIVCTDVSGRIWAFYADGDDWTVGDVASLLMNDNGTTLVYDDIVIDAVYAGTAEQFAALIG